MNAPSRRALLTGASALASLTLLGCRRPGLVPEGALTLRRAAERGQSERDWLQARYTFSFSRYRDPRWDRFGALRVMNEDRIAPTGGFPMHPHEDMEILTWVLDGALEHKDSLGNGGVIQPGLAQFMRAGTGIRHSEFNPSSEAHTHLLQIWVTPRSRGLRPAYDQTELPDEALRDRWALVASAAGEGGRLSMDQDLRLLVTRLGDGARTEHRVAPGRRAWLQVARGGARVNGVALAQGDGLAALAPGRLEVEALGASELLVFDLV